MLRMGLIALSVAALTGGALLALTASVSAHERRQVLDFTLVVGWLTEPAYTSQPNSIDFRVSRTADAAPVTGLEKEVKAEAIQSTNKVPVVLRARSGTPGAYNGYLTPKTEGAYGFHFTGTIEGKALNETFTASPTTFGLVEAPLLLPADTSMKAMDESLQGFEKRIVTLEANDASGKASTAMAVGIAGIVAGVLGLGAGVYGVTRKAAA